MCVCVCVCVHVRACACVSECVCTLVNCDSVDNTEQDGGHPSEKGGVSVKQPTKN